MGVCVCIYVKVNVLNLSLMLFWFSFNIIMACSSSFFQSNLEIFSEDSWQSPALKEFSF